MSGQRLTCLGSSLERHLGNLEEKRGARWREREVTKTVILIKVQILLLREQLVGRQRQWEWQDDRAASSALMLSNTET